MTKSQIFEKLKTLVPYFLVGLALIIAFRVSGSLYVIGDFVQAVWAILSPFFYGFLIAYIINIPVGFFQKLYSQSTNSFILKKQRGFALLTTFLIILGILAAASAFVFPAIISSIGELQENWGTYMEGINAAIANINALELFENDVVEIATGAVMGWLSDFQFENLQQIVGTITGVGTTVFGAFVALIASIYILLDKDRIKALANKLLRVFTPHDFWQGAVAAGKRLNGYFRQYIRTQTVDGLILGTAATIALYFIGSPFFLILGIMLGVVNYIPIFGSLVGTTVAVIVVMITQEFTTGLIAAAVLFVIQQLDANVLQPRLMGDSFSFSPLLVIISITVGSALAGILGMIMAIPMAAILKDVFDEIVDFYDRRKSVKQRREGEI
ncbi:MAG: AI-2E family transporter [Defluviitaleaceae bacterium]|nr:AI-2E family transporter [Defluviitaleaceae bacterium]